MEEFVQYVTTNYPTIVKLTIEHLYLVSISVGAAILSGVPIGILITKDKQLAGRRFVCRFRDHHHPVGGHVRADDPPFVPDQPGNRILARSHRHFSLFAIAHHPQHLHGHQQYRPRPARSGPGHGHERLATTVQGRNTAGGSRHHGRGQDGGGS